ncbi:MAG: rRNA pseudouridine synthase [Deltaproteobacteria bacterium]|nr:rRNA pseudouridine synthase [Deltaproteobacteria bacterium]MBN2688480.1 rRNA pseudouridine synthase [Deltaproteobacteria bacterium]
MEERLQKVMARAGIASRRVSEQMIKDRRVTVNDRVVTELGTKVDADRDMIRVDGKLISAATSAVYIMLNKPAGYLTSLKDDRERPIVTDLIKGVPERIFPVGRLDYDSEGLLVLTNDGTFAYRIQHPKFEIPKTYMVKVKGSIPGDVLKAISGITLLEDGDFKPQRVRIDKANRKSTWVEMTIHEGKNRIIKRLFDFYGYPVMRLVRVAIGNLKLKNLRIGDFRYLEVREVRDLLALAKP